MTNFQAKNKANFGLKIYTNTNTNISWYKLLYRVRECVCVFEDYYLELYSYSHHQHTPAYIGKCIYFEIEYTDGVNCIFHHIQWDLKYVIYRQICFLLNAITSKQKYYLFFKESYYVFK